MQGDLSVQGTPLAPCSKRPLTGFYRDGFCRSGAEDRGTHVVCAEMTSAFLAFTRAQGNDLSSPMPEHRFPGLHPGDRWCLCALRWREAADAGLAPPVIREATHRRALDYVPRAQLLDRDLRPQ